MTDKKDNTITNAISSLSRSLLLSGDSNTDDRLERIWCDAGYPETISTQDYHLMWERNGVAKRIVQAYPDACWSQPPKVYEKESPDEVTAFEAQFDKLERRVRLFDALHKADSLSGIGNFGVVFIGLDDGLEIDQPVPGFDESLTAEKPGGTFGHEVTFLRPLSQNYVTVLEVELDDESPRYGLPKYYGLDLATGTDFGETDDTAQGSPEVHQHYRVHWHRVLHLTDPGFESVVYSPSRLEPVYNDLINLTKIMAGSGEGYWQAAYPGLSFELQDGYDSVDTDSLKTQLVEFAKGIRRFITTIGVRVQALTPIVPEPSQHFDLALTGISTATNIPKRILTGADSSGSGSVEDLMAWHEKVYGRRINYCKSGILLPMIERLQRIGALPEAEAKVSWANPHTMTELERAEIAVKITESMSKYMLSGAEQALGFGDFLQYVVGFEPERVAEIVAKLEGDGAPGSITAMMDERQLERQKQSAEIEQEYQPDRTEIQQKTTSAGQKAGLDQRGAGSSAPQTIDNN